MIFMRDRRPKQRHDTIAHDLIHRPLIAMHGRHHVLQHRVEEVAGFLGIAVGEQLHRPLQVGKEDGHLFALAFERGLGGEDFLRQVAGGVGERGACVLIVRRQCRARSGPSRPAPCPPRRRPAVGHG